MLAQLQQIAGVRHAAVDYGGRYVRLVVETPAALVPATALLAELGYAPTAVKEENNHGVATWYDASSVRDLSAMEAQVIARRVATQLAHARPLSADKLSRLVEVVAAALQRCFTDRQSSPDASPPAFRAECMQAASAGARTVLDNDELRDFVEALSIDLNKDHTHDAAT